MISTMTGGVTAALVLSLGSVGSAQPQNKPAPPISYRVDAEVVQANAPYLNITVTARNIGRETAKLEIPDCAVNVLIYDRKDGTRRTLWNSLRHDQSGVFRRPRRCDRGIVEVDLKAGDSIRGGPLSYQALALHIISDSVPAGDHSIEVTVDVSGRQSSFEIVPLSISKIPNGTVTDTHLDEMRRLMRPPLDSSLVAVKLSAKSGLEKVAPTSFGVHLSAYNGGKTVAYMEFGACSLKLFAYHTPKRTGVPAWRSSLSGPPSLKNGIVACPSYLAWKLLEPGKSASPREFNRLTPTYEILGDSLDEGMYYFRAELALNRKVFSVNADSARIVRKQAPVPSLRTFHGISYAASAQRITSPQHSNDSIEFKVRIRNTSNQPRTIESRDCVPVSGFDSPEMRDSWYMHSAGTYEWLARPCPLHLPQLNLRAGEIVTLRAVTLAPASRLHYALWFSVITIDSGDQPEVEDFALSAEESAGS